MTAEFALALPAVVMVLLLVLGVGMHGAARVAVEEGARAAARDIARGESAESVRQTAHETAGSGSRIELRRDGEYAVVTIRRPVRLAGLIELDFEHTAEAYARVERVPGSP